MSKSLKKLLKKRPSADELDAMLAELTTDGSRGATLLAASLIDEVLRGALAYRFVPLTETDKEELFEGTAPLATFSARIRLAYAIGVVGKKTRQDLHRFRELRNAMAHARRSLSFDTPEIEAILKSFHCVKDLPNYKDETNRELFIGAATKLMLYLITKVGPFPDGATERKLQGNTQLD